MFLRIRRDSECRVTTAPQRRQRVAAVSSTGALLIAIWVGSTGCHGSNIVPGSKADSATCSRTSDCQPSGDICVLTYCDEGKCQRLDRSCGGFGGTLLCLGGACVAGVGCVPHIRDAGLCMTYCSTEPCFSTPCFVAQCKSDGYCHMTPIDCSDGNPGTADYCTTDFGCVHVADQDAHSSD